VLVLRRTGDDRPGEDAGDLDAGDGLDGLRALCVAHWAGRPGSAPAPTIRPGDDRAGAALSRWHLAPG
jgi:hypothetical protein